MESQSVSLSQTLSGKPVVLNSGQGLSLSVPGFSLPKASASSSGLSSTQTGQPQRTQTENQASAPLYGLNRSHVGVKQSSTEVFTAVNSETATTKRTNTPTEKQATATYKTNMEVLPGSNGNSLRVLGSEVSQSSHTSVRSEPPAQVPEVSKVKVQVSTGRGKPCESTAVVLIATTASLPNPESNSNPEGRKLTNSPDKASHGQSGCQTPKPHPPREP